MGLFALFACTQDDLVGKIDRQITITPDLVDFGDLPVGASGSADITFTHVAGDSTTIVDVQLLDITGGGFTFDGAVGQVVTSAAPLVLPATWTATEAGWHQAQLSIYTDEEEDAEHVIELRGHAGDAALWLSPSAVDFGPVASGATATENVSLTNRGDVALTVDGVETGDGAFTASISSTTLGPGQSVNVSVDFLAASEDAVTSTLSVLMSGGVAASAELRANDCENGLAERYDADGDGWTSCAGDCDDTDVDVHSGAAEVCDGVDQDCDGLTDDTTTCFDDDGDGFSEDAGDCNDNEPDVGPGHEEVPDNGIDDDCDGAVDIGADDADGDGFTTDGGDCAEGDADIHPGAIEVCDGADQDCDGDVDEDTRCSDDDGDGLSEDAGDCDDTSTTTFPDAKEDGNGVDDDCDGTVDEGTEWGDDDADGWSERGGDCDDADATVNPGAWDSSGDGVDNDCDGVSA